MPQKTFKVIFVCLGNICRSPAAENIFRHQVREAGLGDLVTIESAGTHDYHPGKAPDKRMTKTLGLRRIPSTGAARQFTSEDLSNFDLVLTMDKDNHARVTALASGPEFSRKVVMFTRFCKDPDLRVAEVPDPYYGDQDGFERVADILEHGCRQLLEHVRGQITQ